MSLDTKKMHGTKILDYEEMLREFKLQSNPTPVSNHLLKATYTVNSSIMKSLTPLSQILSVITKFKPSSIYNY